MTDLAKTETPAPPDTRPDTIPADPMVAMIERLAISGECDPSKFQLILESHEVSKERAEREIARRAFKKAFAAASAEFPDVPQTGRNQHNGKDYATLKDILSTVRPVLSKHGFALSFRTEASPDALTVVANLSHELGHTEENPISLPRDTGPGRNQVQAVGASQTYGQRYTAQALLGLSLGEDTEDDGASSGKIEERPPEKPYSWANTVTQDLPENATPRDKAEALSVAIVKQFERMKGLRQLDNEWDRRATIIDKLEAEYKDLWGPVIEAYEIRRQELDEKRAADLAAKGGPA